MNHPPGTIIFFKNFRFDEPGTATRPVEKNKYYVVLRCMGNAMVVASLPTSQDRIPETVEQEHGCNDYPSGGWTAYVFEKLRSITTNDWGFPFRTYMYGYGVREYNVEVLTANHPRDGQDFVLKGRLTEHEFNELVACLKRSIDIKRGMRTALDGALYHDAGTSFGVSEPLENYGSAQAPAV